LPGSFAPRSLIGAGNSAETVLGFDSAFDPAFGLALGLALGPAFGLAFGLAFGFAFGLAFGLAGWATALGFELVPGLVVNPASVAGWTSLPGFAALTSLPGFAALALGRAMYLSGPAGHSGISL